MKKKLGVMLVVAAMTFTYEGPAQAQAAQWMDDMWFGAKCGIAYDYQGGSANYETNTVGCAYRWSPGIILSGKQQDGVFAYGAVTGFILSIRNGNMTVGTQRVGPQAYVINYGETLTSASGSATFLPGQNGVFSQVNNCWPATGRAKPFANGELFHLDEPNGEWFWGTKVMFSRSYPVVAQGNCTPLNETPTFWFNIGEGGFLDIFDFPNGDWGIIVGDGSDDDEVEPDSCDTDEDIKDAVVAAFTGTILNAWSGQSSAGGNIGGWSPGLTYLAKVDCGAQQPFFFVFELDTDMDSNGNFEVYGINRDSMRPQIPTVPQGEPDEYEWWWNTTCFGPAFHTTNDFVLGLNMGFLSFKLVAGNGAPAENHETGVCYQTGEIGGF